MSNSISSFLKPVFFLLIMSISVSSLAQFRILKSVHEIEIFAGPSLNFPDDNGWSEYIYNSTQGQTIDKLEKKSGYFIGFGIIHLIGKKFEVNGKFSFEKRQYSGSIVTYDVNGNVYGESFTDQKNDYLTFSLVPTYFPSKGRRLHLFSGISYAYLIKSLQFGSGYIQGQYVGSASINTIDGFEKHVVDLLGGVGYSFPINKAFAGIIRTQGNYGLSYTASQNKQHISINSISLSFALRYSK